MPECLPRLKPAEFILIRDHIQRNSGIYLDENKSESLKVSLCLRMQELNLRDYCEYYRILASPGEGEQEFRELLNLITVNETHFFRGKPQFEALRKVVLPDIIGRREKAGRTLRIWSAGCATGEEPYSIAITLLEALKEPETWHITIFGSDISKKALAAAEKGIYHARSLRDTDLAIVQKYFQEEKADTYRLDEKVKKMVSFGYHNLIKGPYPGAPLGGWDIIFCRNVTIYFGTESVRQVINNFCSALSDDGYLFIGYAEMLYHISDAFAPLELEGAFVYRKRLEPVAAQPALRPCVREQKETKSATKQTRTRHKEPVLQRVAGPNEKESNTHYDHAYQYYRAEDFERAEVEAIEATKSNPGDTKAHLLLGTIYVNQEKYDQAEKEIRQVLERDSLLPEAYYLQGVILEKKGFADAAIRELKKATYLDRNAALAYLSLAHLWRAKHMTRAALRAYKNAMKSLRQKPLNEWVSLPGAFSSDALIETCKRDIRQMRAK